MSMIHSIVVALLIFSVILNTLLVYEVISINRKREEIRKDLMKLVQFYENIRNGRCH